MGAVFLDWGTMGPGLDTSGLRSLLPGLVFFDVTTDQQLAARIEGAEFVLTNKVRLTDELLAHCSELRFIGLTATGTDNVDLAAAKQHGVTVCNIRAYCNQSVAEHVFACLLNLTHAIGPYSKDVAAGEWQQSDDFCLLTHPIRELSAMTLGIVGYGELGKAVTRFGSMFGMDTIISARPGSDAITAGRVAFDELLERADVITLHTPMTEQTRNVLSAENLQRTRKGVRIVNCARGGLVDEAALAALIETENARALMGRL